MTSTFFKSEQKTKSRCVMIRIDPTLNEKEQEVILNNLSELCGGYHIVHLGLKTHQEFVSILRG